MKYTETNHFYIETYRWKCHVCALMRQVYEISQYKYGLQKEIIRHSLHNFLSGAQNSCHLQQNKPHNGESLIGKRVQTIQAFHRHVLLLPQLML